MAISKNMILLLLLSGLVSLLGANERTMGSEAVYAQICASCHGTLGTGNPDVPDAPALNTLSEEELVTKLSEIKTGGFDSYHEKMEKNQKIIELRGMKYDSEQMAAFIYNNFNAETH